MALTYKKVMETDYGKLTAAAKAWDDMAGEFKKAESNYAATVRGLKPNWRGEAFGSAYVNFAGTQYEYAAAQTEAKAIADLLRDAHGQFTELKKRLESLVADARKDNMQVDDEGNVRPDLTDTERRAFIHDPDGQALLKSYTQAAASWAKQIQKYVKAIEDADAGVKLSLEGAVKDSNKDFLTGKDDTANGFNAGAKGDIEQYELEYVQDVTTRLNEGKPVSNAEVEGVARILRDNNNEAFKHRTEFSRTFLSGLGADGTIKLANTLNDVAHSGDSGRSRVFGDTNKALADTLSTATQVVFAEGKKNPPYGSKEYQAAFEKWSKTEDAKFYNAFMDDLKKAGLDKFELDVAADKAPMTRGQGQEIRGYQGLVTLMQQGNGYSPQFLGDLTDQMIDAEQKDKDVWDLHGRFEGKNDGWFANDPVDGALGIMSRDPETATGYLDPNADGDKNRLEHLLTKRDWDIVNTTDWHGNVEISGNDTFDKDTRAGLGLALEAATTGRPPGSPGEELGRHSEAEARIMHDTINLLDYSDAEGKEGKADRAGKADELLAKDHFANMRDPLARAFAAYTPDVVDILAGEGPGGRVGQANELADGDKSQIQNSRISLLRFMRGVSEVPDGSQQSENFNLLYQSQLGYMSEQLATGDFSDPKALENRAQRIGEVYGTVTAVGGDLDLDIRDAKNSDATNNRFYGYHVLGGAITGIPVIGDMAQRSVDIVLNERLSVIQAENGLLTKETLGAQNDKAHDTLDKFFASMNDERHFVEGKDALGVIQNEARQSYNGARKITFEALRGES
ncbi:PPE family protein [Streptomyces sp. TRM49041]|uniref:PPE family protein n=1 Tax=Streptomyces sp. TRM49041 TaxID=2603216 RepID=UPI0021CC7310|nr:PPE family protein [Streptomyces sp. TRM49041]